MDHRYVPLRSSCGMLTHTLNKSLTSKEIKTCGEIKGNEIKKGEEIKGVRKTKGKRHKSKKEQR